MTSEDLKTIEGKIFQEYNSDGAVETLLGFGLMMGGFYMVARSSAPFAALIPIFVLLIARAWKKRITYPRLGYVEFSAFRNTQRRNARRLILLAAICTVILAVPLVMMQLGGPRDHHTNRLIFSSVIMIILLVFVWVKRRPWLLTIPALFGFLILTTDLLGKRPYWALLITGFALIVWGFVRLVSFLRRNPLLKDEAAHAESR